MPRKIKIAYPDDKNVDALQSLGLTRPAAKMLLVLQEKGTLVTQKDLIAEGIKQPYIPVAAKELEALGLISIHSSPEGGNMPTKYYVARPLEDVKKTLRHQMASEYSQALDQLAEVWG
jgi:predicted transcriptional regulator